MEVKVLTKTENKIELEIIGETHTLLNALTRELANMENVEIATYHIPHPSEDRAIFRLIVREGNPIEVLKQAISKIRNYLKEIEI